MNDYINSFSVLVNNYRDDFSNKSSLINSRLVKVVNIIQQLEDYLDFFTNDLVLNWTQGNLTPERIDVIIQKFSFECLADYKKADLCNIQIKNQFIVDFTRCICEEKYKQVAYLKFAYKELVSYEFERDSLIEESNNLSQVISSINSIYSIQIFDLSKKDCELIDNALTTGNFISIFKIVDKYKIHA